MPNYLVVSYDLDEQQGLYDVVDCHSEARAEEIVLRVRKDYISGISATFTASELRNLATNLEKRTGAPRNVKEMRRSIEP